MSPRREVQIDCPQCGGSGDGYQIDVDLWTPCPECGSQGWVWGPLLPIEMEDLDVMSGDEA